jgi:protein gp37
MDKRLGRVEWGPHGERVRTSPENWAKPRRWNKTAAKTVARHRVFCASLADWLDNKVPQQWRFDLAQVIKDTPHLDWLLLTKRIENFADLNPWDSNLPKNVWIGITAEDQKNFDRRWEILKHIPAVVRFISYEPAIGQIANIFDRHRTATPDWIIMGGESGNHTRMMEPGWAYEMKRLCAEYEVPFFLKQMTDKAPIPADLLVRQFPQAR